MKTLLQNLTHSPGPWTYEVARTCDTKVSFDISAPHGPTFDRFDVAHLTNPYSGTAEGNARLIASAPELLAALKEMHAAFRFYSKGHELNAIQSAHRAIAKAEGRA